jgi:hypothetical protein
VSWWCAQAAAASAAAMRGQATLVQLQKCQHAMTHAAACAHTRATSCAINRCEASGWGHTHALAAVGALWDLTTCCKRPSAAEHIPTWPGRDTADALRPADHRM